MKTFRILKTLICETSGFWLGYVPGLWFYSKPPPLLRFCLATYEMTSKKNNFEFYGKNKANFCVRLAIAMNIIIALVIIMMDKLNATEWSKIDNITFHKVFGLYSVAFIGSIIACYIAQLIDITIYLWIRKLTDGKWLWLRNNGSTAISLFVDTFIVISFMSVFGILPMDRMWVLIINSYLFKLFFTVCSTPLFYICVGVIRSILKNQ